MFQEIWLSFKETPFPGQAEALSMQDFFYVKDGNKNVRICFSDILYIEAKDKYVTLVTMGGRYLVAQSLSAFEKIFPSEFFCRVHRSYIISLRHTKWFDHNNAFVGNENIPIGKNYKHALHNNVIIIGTIGEAGLNISDFEKMDIFRQIKKN